ncbi:MAG: NADH-quinone oxidoreductase subunit N [Deltaproteobacteria bacterium]|nr:NADH-quinone oxidoreductase subunit N [Deltaproteobacteria bacterium]
MQVMLILPELVLTVTVLVLFAASLKKIQGATLTGIALAGSFLTLLATVVSGCAAGTLFAGAYQVDGLSQLIKFLLSGTLFLVFYMGRGLSGIEEEMHNEFYLFLTLSTLGLVLMSSAVELLTILVCLEISSYALYVVISFRRGLGRRSEVEAGIKYALFGAAATGISLFGLSYIFGLTHTTYLAEISQQLPKMISNQPMAVIGMVLLLCSFFYKLAMFPMHAWTPDIYQGASNETTTFIATLPKIGAAALLIRLVGMTGGGITHFTWVLGVLAVLSMTFGNLAALVQDDIKRLLAYSSIAHAGYMMVGLLSTNRLGLAAVIYYIAGYVLMNLACFMVIYYISPQGENITFADLKGLHKRSPILAFTLAAGAFGMAGIPPTVGFTGKFVIFTAALHKGFYGLVVIAMVNAAVSAFYYLKMARAVYCQGEDEKLESLPLGLGVKVFGAFLIIAIVLVGIMPQSLMQLANQAVATIM